MVVVVVVVVVPCLIFLDAIIPFPFFLSFFLSSPFPVIFFFLLETGAENTGENGRYALAGFLSMTVGFVCVRSCSVVRDGVVGGTEGNVGV